MAIKKYKPTTPSRRFAQLPSYSKELSDKRPEKSLTAPLKKKAGRSRGKISVRHRGGGHKRLYRLIDFKRIDKIGVSGEVKSLEYDPNRSGHIALIVYQDSERRYILAPDGLKVGDVVEVGPDVKVRAGNALPLGKIPVGTMVHNIELSPGQGGQIVRGAGVGAKVMAREDDVVQVKLPSAEIRIFDAKAYATIGQVGNVEHSRVVSGKAGRKRNLGWRPHVRGTAMAAGDHAHGGGEGRTGPGRAPKTVYGKPAHGVRTRKKKKKSNKYIVKSRRSK